MFWEYSFLGLYFIALLLSLVRFSRYYDTPLRYLPFLLAYTLLTEIMGMLIRDSQDYSIFVEEIFLNNNWLIFNLFTLVEFAFFFWAYQNYLTAFKVRWLKLGGLILFVLASLVNAWLYDFTTVSQVYAYWAGGVVLGLMALLYLIQEYRHAPRAAPWRNLLVWMSLGFLIFTLVYIPVKFLRFQVVHAGWEYYSWIRPVHLSAIYSMYGCIVTGLLLMDKMKTPGCPGSSQKTL